MTLNSSFFRRTVLAALAFAAASTTLLPSPVFAQTTPFRVVLATGNPQALAVAADTGLLPSSQHVSLTLTLTPDPARAAALDQLLAAQVTASSPNYHQWLTPAQFAASYGATPAQLSAATAWAQNAGLTVDAISAGSTRVVVSGSAARVQTAFATSLHSYQVNAALYYANATPASLPVGAASLFVAVEGLDNLPTSAPLGDFGALTTKVDGNAATVLSISGTTALRAGQVPEYRQLFRQAAAQGITTLLPAAAGAFADVTAVADTSAAASTTTPRPTWQTAAGLPVDQFRATPDVSVASMSAFTQALTTLAAGGRLGNIAPVLYLLAPMPGVFTQADSVVAGTWEPATGLGVVDPGKFAAAFPSGTGLSYTSFAATNYAPTHGQSTSFTSNVTSGTGGATPTGTVSFVTSAGVTLGTVTLVSGSATFSIATLDSGNYVLNAVYSGDSTYASSQSPNSQIYVAPEPSQLSAIVSGSATVGSNYTITVTDAAVLGVPNGAISATISGTQTTYTAALKAASANSATATFNIPATAPGGITLSITCSPSLNYSCNNPLTTTVQIAKATPTLSISYSPNPPVSGAQITLNAVVSTVGSAPAPTGNVRFLDNGTILNAGALSGGSTSTTGTVPTTSSHSITATYDGDPNYNSISTTAGSNSSSTINTTTLLTSSATTVNAGATITFTASVTPASTGPAAVGGTVSFFDGGNPLGTQNVVNGVATLSTNSLSSASGHSISANYSGDGNYTASSSNTVTLTGGTTNSNTTIALTASTTNPTHGSPVTLSATVAPPSGGATPTGTVTFLNGGTQLAQVALVNGVASYTTSALLGGPNSITATYNGGTNLNPSTSAALVINVQPEATQLAFSLPANPTFGGVLNVQVTVTGASNLGYPTGTVTVQPSGSGYATSSSASVTSAGTSSTGSASVQIQETAAGSVILTATYAGDKNFAASGPISTSVTIARAASTVAVSYSPTPPVAGQSVTLTAKVAFASGTGPTGTIQFKDGSTVLGSGTLDSTGTASLTTTLSTGAHALSAAYSGDGNYLPGNSPSSSTGTGSSATSTTLSLNPPIVSAGSAETLTANVGPAVNGLALTGTVQFVSVGKVLCQATVASGSASCTINPTVVGTQSLTASYLGDTNYAASSSAPASLQVTNPTGGLTASVTPANVTGNTSATVTAMVTAPAGVVPTGSILATIVSSAGVTQSTYTTPLPGSGTANSATVNIPIVAPVGVGTYSIVVSCSNTNFTCNNVTLPFTVAANNNSLMATLTASVTPAVGMPGSTAMVVGTLTAPTGTTLTGTITATILGINGSPVTGAVYVYTLPGTGVTTASYSIAVSVPTALGAYTVSVSCNSTAFTCPTVTTTLTSSNTALIATTTKLTATASTTTAGATTLTAVISTAAANAASPTGNVTFFDGTTLIGTQAVASGAASITVNLATTATHSLTAIYSGDTVYAASTSPAITGTGTGATTTAAITLTASSSSVASGSNVILTATVTGSTATGVAPTGTVSFYIVGANARLLGTVTLVPAGAGTAVAALTTTGLPSGTLTIDAVYSGDANFTTVTSSLVTIGLTDFSLTFNPATLTITRGNSGVATATIAFLGLTGNVTLGCTPATDSAVSCSFTPAQLSASGTSTLRVQTTLPTTSMNTPVGISKGLLGTVSFAMLVFLVLPGKRRRRLAPLLLLLVSVGLFSISGCSQNNFNQPRVAGGSPLGTTILTITTAGTDGVTTIRHTYYYQVTIQ